MEQKALGLGSSLNTDKHSLPAPGFNFPIRRRAGILPPSPKPLSALQFSTSNSFAFSHPGRRGFDFDLHKLGPVPAPATSHPLTQILGSHFCQRHIFSSVYFEKVCICGDRLPFGKLTACRCCVWHCILPGKETTGVWISFQKEEERRKAARLCCRWQDFSTYKTPK